MTEILNFTFWRILLNKRRWQHVTLANYFQTVNNENIYCIKVNFINCQFWFFHDQVSIKWFEKKGIALVEFYTMSFSGNLSPELYWNFENWILHYVKFSEFVSNPDGRCKCQPGCNNVGCDSKNNSKNGCWSQWRDILYLHQSLLQEEKVAYYVKKGKWYI